MIAAGLADGNIAVYDLTCKMRAPRLMSKVWAGENDLELDRGYCLELLS